MHRVYWQMSLSRGIRQREMLNEQMRSPGRLPIIGGENDFILRVHNKVLVISHNIRYPVQHSVIR